MSVAESFRPVVCVADDEEGIRFGLRRLFIRGGYEVVECASGEAVLKHAGERHLDALLLDVRLAGDMDGHEVLRRVRQIDPELPVLMITGYGTIESAVDAMKCGAEDYIVKPVDNARILNKVASRLEVKLHEARCGSDAASNEASSAVAGAGTACLVAESPAMRGLLEMADRIKDQDISVLLTGESGVGKELLARHIHHQSSRRAGPFVAVNCAAFSETLLLSELFGHEKGAFTGADGRKKGCFERAHGGTLFLDEVGDMAPDAQAKLLRVLENREFLRLGGSDPVQVDARIVAATNQDLTALVAEGAFREDLYYRIHVVRMHIPPLRDRREDLHRLIHLFVERFSQDYGNPVRDIPEEAMAALLNYSWPGNVREMKNVLSQSVLLSRSHHLEVFGLPPADHTTSLHTGGADADLGDPGEYHLQMSAATEEVGRRLVLTALQQSGGNKSEAARILGVTRKTLQRKIDRFGIDQDHVPG